MLKIPLIFDIKRASLNDGPGLRTAVFFKGCNLDCFWCHNPEGKSSEMQYAFFKEKCISCNACGGENRPELCPVAARKRYGKVYTVEELLNIIVADKAYYAATGGGVTLSGGECMLYPDFAASIAKACKEQGISVAIDTAGNVPFSHFEKVLPVTDLFLYDIKALDPILHQKGTGQPNDLILANLQRLIQSGKEIIVRVPVIPDFNDGEELKKIKDYCRSRGLAAQLLQYHPLGESKSASLL